MSDKRPIDRQRKSGLSLQIGAEEGISDFYKIGERRLLVVTAKGIYELKLPDQIDPKRTNQNLKPLQQRVLNFGSDDDYVCRVLLTAKVLFRENFLGPQFDHAHASVLAFEGLKDVMTMHQLRLELEQAQTRAWANFQQDQREDGSIRMPSIPDIEALCEAYMQKANHVVTCLEQMAKLFYGNQLSSKWVRSLSKLLTDRYGKDDPFVNFMEQASRFLIFIINTRNSVEHPSSTEPGQRCGLLDAREWPGRPAYNRSGTPGNSASIERLDGVYAAHHGRIGDDVRGNDGAFVR